MSAVDVDKCSVSHRPGKRPNRVEVVITKVTKEHRAPEGDPVPAAYEVMVVDMSGKIYEILKDTQRGRFYGQNLKRTSDFDKEVLIPMNKALAELVLECGDIIDHFTETGSKL